MKGQDKAFQAVADSAHHHGHALILRNHPHLQKKSKLDRNKWDHPSFIPSSSNVTIIKSSSTVDTYELIDASDLVVVHGSTVGIEAVFWGKPVIVVSDSFYDLIDASIYKPFTLVELDSLIGNLGNLMVDSDSSLPYGFYMASFGIASVLYKPKNLFLGSFLGFDLQQKTLRHKLLSFVASLVKKYFFVY